jgi:hypothetical protein
MSIPPSPERKKEGEIPVSDPVVSIASFSSSISVKRDEIALITFSESSVGYTVAETLTCIINLLQ